IVLARRGIVQRRRCRDLGRRRKRRSGVVLRDTTDEGERESDAQDADTSLRSARNEPTEHRANLPNHPEPPPVGRPAPHGLGLRPAYDRCAYANASGRPLHVVSASSRTTTRSEDAIPVRLSTNLEVAPKKIARFIHTGTIDLFDLIDKCLLFVT